MDERNDLITDNTAAKSPTEAKDGWASNDPYATSDELSAPKDMSDPRIQTSFAKSKKVGRAVKKITILTGSALVLGGFGLSAFNIFGNRKTEVKSPDITMSENIIDYNFEIVNTAKRTVTFVVEVDDATFYSLDVSSEGKYEGKVKNVPDYKELVTAKIIATNNVDYRAVIHSVILGEKPLYSI
ncbi:MAG: hypothetical protein K6B65_02340 [Bacilli bacterium]|nr:hypothetical protein [Bacilli bacterium]